MIKKILVLAILIIGLQNCKKDNNQETLYGSVIDEKDSREYKTIKIGDIIWMAEDYKYTTDTIYIENNTLFTGEVYYDQFQAKKYALIGWELPTLQDWQDLLNRYKNSQSELEINGKSNLNLAFNENSVNVFHQSYWVNQSYTCCDYPDSLLKDGALSIQVYCRWTPVCDSVLGVELYKNSEDRFKLGLNLTFDKCKIRYIKRMY